MTPKLTPITDSLSSYLTDNWLRENEILRQLREETAELEMARMQISPEQGQLMALMIKMLGVRNIIEIGVFTGYSALVMAQAMSAEGRMICCDISEEWTTIAKKYWRKAKMDHKITLKLAPALETLEMLVNKKPGSFDLAFIDADKANYENYYEKCLELLKPGGVVLLDNVFWGGSVVDESDHTVDTIAIREINDKIHNDSRVDIAIIPIGDGLSVARKKT